jgi:hypothetical protein
LKFADLETLRLALISDAIPVAVSQTPVMAGFDDQEALWVDTSANLSRAAQTELRRHGVQICKSTGSVSLEEYSCWAQLLPLGKHDVLPDQMGQNPVLFVFHESESLSRLAIEILRLGNDRQSYRWLEPNDDEEAVGLLRVIGPPYYSLLQAIDRIGGDAAPEAFLEHSPRVWVQFGFDHPLAENLKAPEGRMLLLRSPRNWQQLEEAAYRDIYEVLEFPLTEQPVVHENADLKSHLEVSLSLKPGGSSDGAELWVLTDNAVEILNTLVQNADDQLLHRLAFAVGKGKGDKQTIILRTRQSKMQPPVLEFSGKAREYKPYLKLPNLFLPAGKRLHPPLRRDKVRQLLADDTNQVVWLAPTGEDGEFTPESIPEDAFRPLWDWVDYVLDHENEPLQAWVQASQFDFEPFICEEENRPEKPKKSPDDKKEKKEKKGHSPAGNLPADDANRFEPRKKPDEDDQTLEDPLATLDLTQAEPSVLQKMLKEAEEQFVAFEGGLDADERRALWPELARLNAELKNADEAGLCWGNALWGHDLAPIEQAWRWFMSEAQAISKADATGTRVKSWTTRVTTVQKANRDIDGADLDRLLSTTEPGLADLRALAAYLVFASRKNPTPPALVERLNPIQRFLEQHERVLPIRFTWLAWIHLAQLSKGDVLALARARDRVLERLFTNGLRPEQDLPSFLRFAGQPTSQRFRAVRQWMTQLAEYAQQWVKNEAGSGGQTPMTAYIDLIFGFGLGRLGEIDTANQMAQRANAALGGKDDVHQFLLGAYGYRIKQALEGKPHGGPLPTEQVELLTHMDRMPRYVVDRLRQHSRILEPNEKIDPYRYWGGRISELDRTLAELVDLTNKDQIAARVKELLKEHAKGAKGKENTARILRSALDLAPRISEDFAREMLERVTPAYDALPEPTDQPSLMDQAKFLENALGVAAHFDRVEYVHPLVARFQKMLQSQKGDRAVQAMETLAGQCFKGLRKLGMREEISNILTQMASTVLEGQDIRTLEASKTTPAALRALLHVAAGWYYFGKDREAEPVIAAARQMLFKDELSCKEKTLLACTYAGTVGQAPVEIAQKRLEELFQKLSGIRDTYTTNTYYSLSQLDVIESVVLAVVSDDFTLGTNARRWLDDDEYLVRKRIHRDMRTVLEKQQ